MEFTPRLDTTELAELAAKCYAIVEKKTDEEAEPTVEQLEAEDTLTRMATALSTMGIDAQWDDIASQWEHVGETMDYTLVREDYIREFLEERAINDGNLTKDSLDFLGESIDWNVVAENQDGQKKISFGTYLNERGIMENAHYSIFYYLS